jgi:RimJ/RimL family protein N-acetyltransferase
MEMMPYHPERDTQPTPAAVDPVGTTGADPTAWRLALPWLRGQRLTLRELRREDAPSLFALLTTDEVARFISPPPSSVAGFEKFIAWAQARRAEGRYACFAVVPEGETVAVGMFQIRLLEAGDDTAEWGFALGAPHWGTGLFLEGAQLVLAFAFEQMGLARLEARAAIPNGRGNGALRKIGAVPEAVLRQAFERHGERLDQVLWALLRDDWRAQRHPRPVTVH